MTGDRIELTANKDYWQQGLPKIKDLTLRVISDDSMRTVEMQSGGVDIILNPSLGDLQRLRSDPKVKILQKTGLNTRYLIFNAGNPPFNNELLRQAVAYAIDIPASVKGVYGDVGTLPKGIISPAVDGFYELPMRSRDLAKAKDLMAKAGYPNGFETKIITDLTQTNKKMGEVIQAQLADVGIKAQLSSLEQGSFQKDMYGNMQMMIYGFSSSTLEPDKTLRRWHNKAYEFGAFKWNNQEYSDLIDKAAATLDVKQRNEMYAKVQQMLFDQVIMVPYLHADMVATTGINVKGLKLRPADERHLFMNVFFGQ